MAIQNDFLPFAVGAGANVLSQSAYAALAALESGYQAGTAQSAACNKTWRQSSVMTAVIAQFIVAQSGQAAVDDGTTGALLANFTAAVSAASRNSVVLVDTGSANAYAAANAAPFTALPTATGIAQTFSVGHTNTGASTYAPDGLPAAPIFGSAGVALQGGELVAGGIATLTSYVGPLINGGALCWVLVRSVGGAMQVPPAQQSNHAVNFGQLGMLANNAAPIVANAALTQAQSGTFFEIFNGATIALPTAKKGLTYILSAGSSAQGFTLSSPGPTIYNGGNSGTSITFPAGVTAVVYCDSGSWWVASVSGGAYQLTSSGGFVKFSNGLIVQIFKATLPASGSGTSSTNVLWPTGFNSACFGVLVTPQQPANSANGYLPSCGASGVTISGALITGDTLNPGNSAAIFNQTVPVTVVAFGF